VTIYMKRIWELLLRRVEASPRGTEPLGTVLAIQDGRTSPGRIDMRIEKKKNARLCRAERSRFCLLFRQRLVTIEPLDH